MQLYHSFANNKHLLRNCKLRSFVAICYNIIYIHKRGYGYGSISKIIRYHWFKQAKTVGEVMSRSGAGQIEHWAKIGKIAEENPDLSFEFIRDSLLAKAEIENGLVDDYEFDRLDNLTHLRKP